LDSDNVRSVISDPNKPRLRTIEQVERLCQIVSHFAARKDVIQQALTIIP